MCILLKLDYTKFGVSNLFSSKVIKEKPLGGWLLVKEGLTIICFEMNAKTTHQIVIKPQRHKKLARPTLKIWLGMALSIVFWASNQPYTPLLPKLLLISCHKKILFTS